MNRRQLFLLLGSLLPYKFLTANENTKLRPPRAILFFSKKEKRLIHIDYVESCNYYVLQEKYKLLHSNLVNNDDIWCHTYIDGNCRTIKELRKRETIFVKEVSDNLKYWINYGL